MATRDEVIEALENGKIISVEYSWKFWRKAYNVETYYVECKDGYHCTNSCCKGQFTSLKLCIKSIENHAINDWDKVVIND